MIGSSTCSRSGGVVLNGSPVRARVARAAVVPQRRGLREAPPLLGARRRGCYLAAIFSRIALALSATSVGSGADRAFAAAAFWPASETMYSPKPLTMSAVALSSYVGQAMKYDARKTG